MQHRDRLVSLGFQPEKIHSDGLEPATWLFVSATTLHQGWKLHVSSRSDRFPGTLSAIAPVLRERGTCFKIPASEELCRVINNGEGGSFQVGKMITIYPDSTSEAVAIAKQLALALDGFPGPVIDNELRISPRAPVYARYGSFSSRTRRTKLGITMPILMDTSGQSVPDLRSVPMHRVLELESPFDGACECTPDGLFDGRFLSVGQIAETFHSRVHAGVDLEVGRECVLKYIKRHAGVDRCGRDSAERMQHESVMLSRLSDLDHIPKVYGFAEDSDWAALALETIKGDTVLERGRQRPGHEFTILLLQQLLGLLQDCHQRNIVLGDLSPANLLIEPSGKIRLIDLEFASELGAPAPRYFGTKGYTCPDLLAGAVPEFVHDYYSVAAIVYYLVTGVELASVPNSDVLLRAGDNLPPAWRHTVAELLTGTASVPQQTGSFAIASTGLEIPESRLRVETLNDLGRSVAGLAHWSSQGPGVWLSRHPFTRGEQYRDLYMGDAGIALALLRIGLSAANLELVEVAMRVAERLHTTRDREPSPLPGLLIGEAGVGLLHLTLHHLLGDSIWLQRASQVSDTVSAIPYESPDLVHGAAGRGLFHLWLYRYSREPRELLRSLAAARHLAATCEHSPAGPLWRIPDGFGGLGGQAVYGLAHGSAGVAYFLAELQAESNGKEFEPLLKDVARSLQDAARQNQKFGVVDWPDAPEGQFRSGVWCHGSAGIAFAFLKLANCLNEPGFLETAKQAAWSAMVQVRCIGPTQCHGAAGLIELYLDLFAATGAEEYLMLAKKLGNWLERGFLVVGSHGSMIASERPDVFTPELMVGSSGAAAALARLYRPSSLGYFLNDPAIAIPGAARIAQVQCEA